MTPNQIEQLAREIITTVGHVFHEYGRIDAYELQAVQALITSALASEWRGMDTLKLERYSVGANFCVSETVVLSFYYKETGVQYADIGRVWLDDDGTYSLPDNKYREYERATHWKPVGPLPTPPEANTPEEIG